MSSESVHHPDPFAVTVGRRIAASRTGEDDDGEDDFDLDDSLLRAVAAAPFIPVESQRLAPGIVVGESFRIDSVLGAGAMGVVYEAFDLTLDRRVALKLHAKDDDDVRTSRMWREAKAMARLAHPNVIAVHEVGEHEGRVFIAMELVEGGSVREWLRDVPPGSTQPWREILRVFTQAAQGLAAAHAVELVHRDFKPDNILLGRDGRVRVADFGLARAATDDEPELKVRMPSDPMRSPSLDERLTQTGASVGTPAYMAPEQMAGLEVDHRCDQFSFCVALYEGLYGTRPFEATSFIEQADRIASGEVRTPPSGHDVPGWLHAVVLRGLRPAPKDRFESMDALLVALRADPSRRRGRIALGLGVVAALGLTAWVTRVASVGEEPCRDMADDIVAIWNPEVASAVEQALRATGSPLADDAVERVRPVLDDYSAGWGRQRTEACRATRVRGEQSESMLDRRMVCLDHRRQQLDAVVSVFLAPDAEVVENAVPTLDTLGSLDACADLESLQAQVPPPDDEPTRRAVTEARARIAAIGAAARAGRSRSVRQDADNAVEQAIALGYAPLRAQAHHARHLVLHSLAEHEPAIVDAVTAHRLATEVSDVRIAWRSALAVARDVGRNAPSTNDALRWIETSEGWGRRFELDVRDRSHASRVRADVLQHGDRLDEALAELERSLASLTADSAPASVLAGNHVGQAYLLKRVSRLDEARRHALEGIEQLVATYGDNHPQVAGAYSILGQIEHAAGDLNAALAASERCLAIRSLAFGDRSLGFAAALRERAGILTSLGRLDPAIADYERALEIFAGLEHPEPAEELMTIGNLASTLNTKGERARALEYMEVSLERSIEAFGAQSMRVAQLRINYGGYLSGNGRYEEGLAQTELGLSLMETLLGRTHSSIGIARLNLALSCITLERFDDARTYLAEATAIFTQHYPPTHFWHGRVARVDAALLEAEGSLTEAAVQWRAALTLLESALAPENADVIRTRYRYGRILVDTGEPLAAIEPLTEAVRMCEEVGMSADDIGRIRYALGRALWGDPTRRTEALTLVDTAIGILTSEDPELAEEAKQWAEARR